ncbi:hypothetical protein ACFQV2_11885 [Actinokineospora soli]|uniref:HEAT repeat-containing protein n=1 Tax=Actinokineospora soli TaxID=1048753 RepID=A0ABW2TLV2_9PSEU
MPQVRDRAREACARRTPVEVVTALAPLALAVERREAGRWLADVVRALLRTSPAALTAALSSPDRRTRRAAYAIAVETGLSTEHLLRAARTDPDLPVRILCADAAIRSTADREVISGLLTSGTAAIRAHALQALGDTGSAVAALPDRTAIVRATARFVLRRAGHDPAAHYRSLLADGLPSVIAGLGECGTHSDIALLLPWLGHPSSRGRAETVRALRRLGHPPIDLLPLLTDPVSSVTRQVATALLPHARSLDPTALLPSSTKPRTSRPPPTGSSAPTARGPASPPTSA